MTSEMFDRMRDGQGFIAALDQSGGSTPKTLAHYGIPETAYSGEDQMFDRVHDMRTRIITNPAFSADRIVGVILFKQTMQRSIEGKGTAEYLWQNKKIVPFLKVDHGLDPESNGVRLMKPMPDLATVLEEAKSHGVFGTKMRSVIAQADESGITSIVDQQFAFGKEISATGLVPIIEPEVDIKCPNKLQAETILRSRILDHLNGLGPEHNVMLKLTIPDQPNFYADLVSHARVVRVVALSGGYSREEANRRLMPNAGVIASFSRALLEGLTAQQTDDEFTAMLDASINSIYRASVHAAVRE